MCCFLDFSTKDEGSKLGRIRDLFMVCRWELHKEHFRSQSWRRTHVYPFSVRIWCETTQMWVLLWIKQHVSFVEALNV